MHTIAEIIANQNYDAMRASKGGRRQPKCRLIPPGARLIRIT